MSRYPDLEKSDGRSQPSDSIAERIPQQDGTRELIADNAAISEAQPQRRMSRYAIAALVLSICSQVPVLPFFIVPLVSFAFSLAATIEIRRQRSTVKGTSFVAIAVILAFLGLANSSWIEGDLALIPKIKAKNEQTLVQTLNELRMAIKQFHADTGMYPATLTDLTAPEEKAVQAHVPTGTYHGPYISYGMSIDETGVPINPMNGDLSDMCKHWHYNPATGQIQSAVDGVTAEGRHYRDL